MKSRSQLMIMCQHLNVKPGRVKNAVSFAQYFCNNWDRVAPMWVYAYRKELPLQVKYCSNVQISKTLTIFISRALVTPKPARPSFEH